MPFIKAEYIWLDGTRPTAQIRSKTKIIKALHSMRAKPPVWGFDGSSTNQAPGEASDCVLKPVYTCRDPLRGDDNILVLCEVMNTDGTPHKSNTRDACVIAHEAHREQQMLFGLEQEYTFFYGLRPLGFTGMPGQKEQGDFYCGVGADNIFGRDIVEEHMDACLHAGIDMSGINAEVMPGQWEFQIGAVSAPKVADQLVIARWLLMRIAERHGVTASFAGKPATGDWNGAGCHANVSSGKMRQSYDACVDACVALGERASHHIENYGHGRRPNANCDPYVVTRLLTEAICEG